MKKSITLILILTILMVSVVLAGTAQDRQDIKNDRQQAAYSKMVLHKLSNTVSLWHEANLHGDKHKIALYTQEIYNVIEEDIRVAAIQVLDANKEKRQSKAEAKEKNKSQAAKFDDRKDYVDDVQDSNVRSKYFKSKKRLLKSIKQSQSFSYSYRLLNDYLELLRREVAAEKIEVAEDIKELHEDR